MEPVTLALSAALAQVLTNIDNMLLLLALLAPVGVARAVSAYVIAQVAVLSAAVFAGLGAQGAIGTQVGYLGLFPLGLGLWGLWQQISVRNGAGRQGMQGGGGALPVVVLMFLGLSLDSFTVFTALLADTAASLRPATLAGAGAAVVLMGLAAMFFSRALHRYERLTLWLERLGPWVMILAGLYVLSDTGTDVL